MSSYRSLAVAGALSFAVACGNAPNGERQGGGGKDGFGNDAGPTPAERTGSAANSGRGLTTLSEADRAFVEKVSMSNQMEVDLGNLAEDKAENDAVKQFAEQLVRDHETANRELESSLSGGDAVKAHEPGEATGTARGTGTAAMRGGGAEQPAGSEMALMHEQMTETRQKLDAVSGVSFDRAYLEEMVMHHQKNIQEFERAVQSDNPQVRSFAERTLPTLREHLQKARQLQQSSR